MLTLWAWNVIPTLEPTPKPQALSAERCTLCLKEGHILFGHCILKSVSKVKDSNAAGLVLTGKPQEAVWIKMTALTCGRPIPQKSSSLANSQET